jgi:hypothetical protein
VSDERKPTQRTPRGKEIPVPSREDFDQSVKKVAGAGSRKRPDEKRRPPERSESTDRWQRMEREADADIAAGRVARFDTSEEFVADLDAD